MNKNNSSFLDYINKPMSLEDIRVAYSTNNIYFEKCELYGDFVQSLLLVVFDTYLGDDVLNYDNQFKHFEWCWNKVVKDFELEGVRIDNPKLYNYFLEFTFEVFYIYPDKTPFYYKDQAILNIWIELFNFTKVKTNSELDTLVEIYKLFENSLK
jgi:hypothetical protein